MTADLADLIGYKVEAADGAIGKVDRHSEYVGRQFMVVDTGPWIFGRHVLVPASVVTRVDEENETVHLSATRAEVKDAPEFERGQHGDDMAAIQIIEHYSSKNSHT
ncbi:MULTISPECIES: PRC-barrel domain containing protein [unclassified Streptomyces]|uniref:PRC-barrel domain containing protein n=1 Tax=unclassified Streptomyces TaxID=2593676 RepID=UPI003411B67B